MFCSQCGTQNSDQASYCSNCGHSILGGAGHVAPAGTSASDTEFLETAIGPKNTAYYLRQFARFAVGKTVSWNWPAFFVTFYWLLHRKMWLYAVLYFIVLPIVLGIVAAIAALALGGSPDASSGVFSLVYLGVVFVLVPMFANRLYYGHLRRKIDDVKQLDGSDEKRLRTLASTGGTSPAGVIVAIVLLVPTIGIIAAIALPAYQDYTIRAQVSEGLTLVAGVRTAVTDTIVNTGQVPGNRAEAGLSPNAGDTSGTYVNAIDVSGGRIDITYGATAHPLIADRMLSLTPYAVDDGNDDWSVVWRCGYAPVPAGASLDLAPYSAGNMEQQYLPSACRGGRRLIAPSPP